MEWRGFLGGGQCLWSISWGDRNGGIRVNISFAAEWVFVFNVASTCNLFFVISAVFYFAFFTIVKYRCIDLYFVYFSGKTVGHLWKKENERTHFSSVWAWIMTRGGTFYIERKSQEGHLSPMCTVSYNFINIWGYLRIYLKIWRISVWDSNCLQTKILDIFRGKGRKCVFL